MKKDKQGSAELSLKDIEAKEIEANPDDEFNFNSEDE
jgi:hypothetical protein